jgi:mannuronan 5-epimerase
LEMNLRNFWMAIPIVVIVLISNSYILTSLMVSQLVEFNWFPSLQRAEAAATVRHKVSLGQNSSSPINTDDIIGSSVSKNVHTSCIKYIQSKRTITVSCTTPARLTDVNNAVHDNSILAKQTSDGVWLLSANLVISNGAIFHIDSTDTKWLKINSKVVGASSDSNSSKSIRPAYWIDVHGSLKIDSVKITSWDPTTNYYAITNGSRTGSGVFIMGAPRPSIVVENNATGTTDIRNSEIAYLGYEQGKHKGGSGLSYYYGGDGSVIENNDIHHVYFGLYTFGVGHMVVANNIIRNSGHYGLDPHTGTHDMIIRNNTVYNNNGSGIICSLNCFNILIENNKVHNNAGDGIDFSRNMYNSIARNNIVYNEPSGVFVSQSHKNQIYNNTISKSGSGINVNSGSSNNKFSGNTILNSLSNAILLASGASANTFTSNKISGSTPESLKIEQDPTSKNNTFSNNQIIHSSS